MALSPDEIKSIIEAFTAGTKDQQAALEELQGVSDDRLQALQDEFDAIQQLLGAREAERASVEAATAALGDNEAASVAAAAATGGLISQIFSWTKNLGKAKKATEDLTEATENQTDAQNGTEKSLKKLIDLEGDLLGGLVGRANALHSNIKQQGVWIALMKESLTMTLKLSTSIYDAEAAFRKSTGATKEFSSEIGASYERMRHLGVQLEDTSKAQASLYRNFIDFTFATKSERATLTDTASLLTRLGVDTDSFAKGLQTQTKAFGMSSKAGANAFMEIAHYARETGQDVGQLSGQYAAMSPKLAKLGAAGHKAFMDLAKVSKITGMEMSKILAMTDKFDTFEGAADQAGKLNAALGGNFVNAMDLMMETDPVKRFNQIRDSIMGQGLAFDDMSYYQRKFFVNSIEGLETEADLANMLSGEMDLLSSSTEMTTEKAKELSTAAQQTQTLKESLQTLFATITPIVTPLIEQFTKFIQGLTATEEGLAKTQAAVATFATFGSALVVLGPLKKLWLIIKGIKGAFKLMKAGGGLLGALGGGAGGAAGGAGAAGKLLKLGGGLRALMGPVGIATVALPALFAAFKGFSQTNIGRKMLGLESGPAVAPETGTGGLSSRSMDRASQVVGMMAPQGGSTNVNNQFNPAITVKVGDDEVTSVVEKGQAQTMAQDLNSVY